MRRKVRGWDEEEEEGKRVGLEHIDVGYMDHGGPGFLPSVIHQPYIPFPNSPVLASSNLKTCIWKFFTERRGLILMVLLVWLKLKF